jgi:hypothetical protein
MQYHRGTEGGEREDVCKRGERGEGRGERGRWRLTIRVTQ